MTGIKELRRLSVAVLLATAAGCGFADSRMAWSPDSKSLFYGTDDHSIKQYDLEKKATRVLERGSDAPTNVAISLDGNFAAVSAAGWGSDCSGVVVSIYNLAKDQLVASKSQLWGNKDSKRDFRKSACFWCPSNRRVLICYLAGEYSDSVEAVVYDTEKATLGRIKGSPPAASICSYIGISPIRPDGKGFLAMDNKPGEFRFSFVDWEGWERKIEKSENVTNLLDALEKTETGKLSKAEQDSFAKAMFIPVPRARWDGNVIVCPFYKGALRIDTDRHLIEYQEMKEQAEERHRLAEEGVLLRETFAGDRFALQILQDRKNKLVQIVDLSKDRRRTLVSLSDAAKDSCTMARSPNGNFIAVRYSMQGSSKVLVMGKDGEPVASLDAAGGK